MSNQKEERVTVTIHKETKQGTKRKSKVDTIRKVQEKYTTCD